MTYTAPVAEQRFVLDHLANLDVEPDMLDAVLEGAGQLAEGEWAPLATKDETIGAKWTPDGVVMPEGYRAAYEAFVDGGWGTIGVPETHGGHPKRGSSSLPSGA